MKIDLQLEERQSGEWSLSKFEVDKDAARNFNLHCIFGGQGNRCIQPGTYWRLKRGGTTVMSNTPAEVGDHWRFIEEAEGDILIAGLGLGMVLRALLNKETTKHVTVVEKSKDVINMVAEFYTNDPRVEIVNADIFEFKTDKHYDWGWFDIWDNISGDEYEEMKTLMRRFSRKVEHKDCWLRRDSRKLYLEDKHWREERERWNKVMNSDGIKL